jgi:hypothetical protein
VAWSFGQANISWNDRREDLCAEEASQVGGHLARERGALIVHGEKNSFYTQGGIQRASDAHERVQ